MKYLIGLVIISILLFSYSLQDTKTSHNAKAKTQKESKSNNISNIKVTNEINEKNNEEKHNFLQLALTKPKKAGRSTSVLKKIKLGKFTIIVLKNHDLYNKVKKLKKYETYARCNKKTGFLNYINNRPTDKKKEITVYPIYVTLNQHTLSLFYTYQSTTLFKILKLDSIQRVALQYNKTYCFDIIINELSNKKLKTGPLSLCAKNMNEMKNWIRAILEFKECKINRNNSSSMITHQGRTLIDFNKINRLIKKNVKRTTSVSQIAYSGNNSIAKQDPIKKEERRIISQEISKILHTIHMTKIAKNQLRRKMVSQFKKTRGKTKGVYRTQKLLHSIMLKKSYAEKQQYSKMIQKLNTKRTTSILKNISMRISELSVFNRFI